MLPNFPYPAVQRPLLRAAKTVSNGLGEYASVSTFLIGILFRQTFQFHVIPRIALCSNSRVWFPSFVSGSIPIAADSAAPRGVPFTRERS